MFLLIFLIYLVYIYVYKNNKKEYILDDSTIEILLSDYNKLKKNI